MRTIALEGPSFAGKTSTLSALRSLLPSERLVTYGCYVDEIENVDEIPPAQTRSALEQLEAFKLFMEIEARRVADLNDQADGTDLVVLDRSVDTLLAHAYALDHRYGYGVHDQAQALLPQLAYLLPDQTFYLDASHQTLQRRRRRLREPFDSFLLDPKFIGHFRHYFTESAFPVSKQINVIHAEESQLTVADHIARMLV